MTNVADTTEPNRAGPLITQVVLYALPIVILGSLTAIYAISPEFYLTWILESQQRETQAVEISTFIAGLIASILLARAAWLITRSLWPNKPDRSTVAIIVMIAAATIFFTGEEISWGQSYLGWKTPENYAGGETNLHNVDLPIRIQSLGSLFLIVMFFGIPIAWAFRQKLNLPESWRLIVAPGPVIFTFACAFAWSRVKDLYRTLYPEAEKNQADVYVQFVEQMKEHKELLFAIALLMYGLHVLRQYRQTRSPSGKSPGI